MSEKQLVVVIDIGGEGRYPEAININPFAVYMHQALGQEGEKIPNLVRAFGEYLPFASNSVDRIIVESSPISPRMAHEIVRTIKPKGSIGLYHPTDYLQKRNVHLQVAEMMTIVSIAQHNEIAQGIAMTRTEILLGEVK